MAENFVKRLLPQLEVENKFLARFFETVHNNNEFSSRDSIFIRSDQKVTESIAMNVCVFWDFQ